MCANGHVEGVRLPSVRSPRPPERPPRPHSQRPPLPSREQLPSPRDRPHSRPPLPYRELTSPRDRGYKLEKREPAPTVHRNSCTVLGSSRWRRDMHLGLPHAEAREGRSSSAHSPRHTRHAEGPNPSSIPGSVPQGRAWGRTGERGRSTSSEKPELTAGGQAHFVKVVKTKAELDKEFQHIFDNLESYNLAPKASAGEAGSQRDAHEAAQARGAYCDAIQQMELEPTEGQEAEPKEKSKEEQQSQVDKADRNCSRRSWPCVAFSPWRFGFSCGS
ncbi:unnamed protein product [Effrenium voratum]|nr:unnamed protein product [Effrenium voratum]